MLVNWYWVTLNPQEIAFPLIPPHPARNVHPMNKRPQHLRDANQIAKAVADIATRQEPDKPAAPEKATVTRARKAGAKGGPARAEKLSAERRSEIARKAAAKRWG